MNVRFHVVALALASACAGPQQPSSEKPADSAPVGIAALRLEAERVAKLIHAPLVDELLAGVPELPAVATRKLYRSEDKSRWLTAAEYEALAPADRTGLTPVEVDEETYYTTHFGSPISYARPLQILSEHGLTSLRGKKILDFGYGYIGHLRLFALAGADAHGVDVAPMLPKLYSEAGDTGAIGSKSGKITLHHGRYPAEPELVKEIGEGYDLIISKNVLKLGYIHPRRKADPKHLIDLGVTDEVFVQTLHSALVPHGLALVYNLSPAQAPEDKPYIPWADGETAFARDLWEKSGFIVHELDKVDHEQIRALARALGWDQPYQGEPGMDLEKDLFAWYTLVEKK